MIYFFIIQTILNILFGISFYIFTTTEESNERKFQSIIHDLNDLTQLIESKRINQPLPIEPNLKMVLTQEGFYVISSIVGIIILCYLFNKGYDPSIVNTVDVLLNNNSQQVATSVNAFHQTLKDALQQHRELHRGPLNL